MLVGNPKKWNEVAKVQINLLKYQGEKSGDNEENVSMGGTGGKAGGKLGGAGEEGHGG